MSHRGGRMAELHRSRLLRPQRMLASIGPTAFATGDYLPTRLTPTRSWQGVIGLGHFCPTERRTSSSRKD